jgi:hypothetical protein
MSATELQTQMPRRGFTLKARARPALASLSAGFTNSDLALAPMPAIGQLAGKEPEKKKKMTFGEVMKLASQRAFRGGAAGFAAGVVQVRAFPSQPGARRSATAHAKTTKSPRNNKQSMTGAPGRGRVDARAREVFRCRARRRTRLKHEAFVETRRARSRCRARGVAGRAPFARTRDNPNRSGTERRASPGDAR